MYPTEHTAWAVRQFAREMAELIVRRWEYNQQVRLERARATGEFYEI